MSAVAAPLTCITCRVLFAKSDLQRDHYRTDWHRYNLKRKVAELPPVSAEVFQKKVLSFREQANSVEEQSGANRCGCCNKTFRSTETFDDHCRSKKHKDNELRGSQLHEQEGRVVKEDEDLLEEEEDESSWTDEGDGLGLEECLFCLEASQSMEANLQHMSLKHGFFIPDLEYCTDLEGFVTYLGEKVALGRLCLWCNERRKRFHSIDAVQKHMRDKAHCKVQHDSESMLEYADFYDFSSSYPDSEPVEVDEESFRPNEILEERDWQLVLPSGSTVGHRALMRYYKQNLRGERKPIKDRKHMRGIILDHYKALGWTGTSGEVAIRIAKDMRFMRKLKSTADVKLGIKANKLRENCTPR